MRRFITFGPAIVVLITTLVTLVAAPAAVRMVGYANTDAQIRLAQQTLAGDDILVRMDQAVRAIAESVEPSVVHIGVDERAGGGRWIRQSQGSGWVYDEQGHIVTNAHVVRGAQRISLQFQDGRTVDAEMLGYDTSTDVAVLQAKTTEGLFPVRRADGDRLRQGDRVFAFGSPFGFKFSMSEGIVSGLARDPRSVIGQSGYTNFIQTDAAVNPGNSGGPLVDAKGQLVGMNVAIATGSRSAAGNEGQSAGISFHIPLSTIESVVEQFIAGQPLSKGFFGINLPMDRSRPGDTDAHERMNRQLLDRLAYRGQGVVIVDVEPDGPAAKAGLRASDVIVKIGDQRATSIAVARALIANHAPGATLNTEIWRNGESIAVPVVLGARPVGEQLDAVIEAVARFGMGEVIKPGDELLISEIARNSGAFRAGLRPQMVVTSVEGRAVAEPIDFYLALASAGIAQGRTVSIGVRNADGTERNVEIQPNG